MSEYKKWKRCWLCGRRTKKKGCVESPKFKIIPAPICYKCQPAKANLIDII
jgi:hypothetical protein